MTKLKWVGVGLGSLIAIAHIGVLGHLVKRQEAAIQVPTINIPHGDYSSYTIRAGKEGYEIEYKANDPKVMSSERSLDLDKERRGIFGGGGREKRQEYRRDEYTMDGRRNVDGGAIDAEGKSAREVECIVADAGARSQGAMAGTSIAAGVGVPAVIGIPYVGWLAAGWVSLLGGQIGETVGSEVGGIFNDC